ncbi:hypothetical protein GWK47_032682 [Chionoecetes opilio]|uniref:Uncharacterized protein n=1 Tax=Chionoecetes opilio TaxID=41210 RepID=A0A8J5D4B2_CHIOP|nr:hypothetical protein GWK47_032682 [Chionoecetes opilio]
MRQLETSMRVDVVGTGDLDNSIKESTREKRGKGVRKGRGQGPTKVPGPKAHFRVTHKQGRNFPFPSEKIIPYLPRRKAGFSTLGPCSRSGRTLDAALCRRGRHKNWVHLQDALERGAPHAWYAPGRRSCHPHGALLQHTKRAVYQVGIGNLSPGPQKQTQLLKGAVGHGFSETKSRVLSGARSRGSKGVNELLEVCCKKC